MNARVFASSATVVALLLASADASAWTYFFEDCYDDDDEPEQCCDIDGQHWKLPAAIEMRRDNNSFPIQSHGSTAFYKAVNGWASLVPNALNMVTAAVDYDPALSYTDNISHVFTGACDYGDHGCWGITHIKGVKEGGQCKILAADVRMDTDITWVNLNQALPDPPLYAPSERGYTTMIHEFGHAHGFGHNSEFSIMNNVMVEGVGARKPVIGSDFDALGRPFQVRLMATDVVGLRNVYWQYGTADTNIAASSARLDNGGVVAAVTIQGIENNITWNPCGLSADPRLTYVNTGTVGVTVRDRIYLSLSQTNHTLNPNPSWVMWTRTGTIYIAAQTSYTAQVSFPFLCGLPTGTYYMYHSIDFEQQVAESNEDDNIVRMSARLYYQ